MSDKQVALEAKDVADAGFFGVSPDPTPNSHYTFAGMAAGLPTPETQVDVIANANDAMLALAVSGEDAPAPTISALTPSSAVAGSADLLMKVTGSGFVLRSTIIFNGDPNKTTRISDTELQTTVRASIATTPGDYPVSVRTGPPGGGDSNSLPFTFDPPARHKAK
jgi:hypothetical protein